MLSVERIKEKHPVIYTIPSANGWEIQVVCDSCDKLEGYNPKPIEPNLEHAYVHFFETSADNLN